MTSPKLLNAWRELTGASRRIRQNVENWFETAILAFDERYEAEMRRWTLGLGFVVAVLLDASFFKLAKTAFGASELRLTKLQAPDLSLETIPGLLITTLLLSAGAPFWRDILQSLFEVKSRLREQKELAGNLMGR